MRFNITTILLSIMLGFFIQATTNKNENFNCKIAVNVMVDPTGGFPPPPPPTQL